MKKIISAFIIFVVLSFCLPAAENVVSFSAGLSTGIPFYGSDEVNNLNNSIDNKGRVIVGAYTTINFNIIEQASLFFGADLLNDFNWNSDLHSNHIHFALPIGFKIYPNLLGLNFGISYLLGFRADFINLPETNAFNGIVNWGNGFKIHTEYNFAKYGSSKHLPTLGFSWTLMPRGQKTFDNILTFYTGVNF